MPALVVLGARNLGGAILDHFRERGWDSAAVARSEDTLARVTVVDLSDAQLARAGPVSGRTHGRSARVAPRGWWSRERREAVLRRLTEAR